MRHIRPISDLRNNFTEISKIVHETAEPVFLTKNGYGEMVVMSFEAYERLNFESEVYHKLKEAEMEAAEKKERFSHKEVFDGLRQTLEIRIKERDV
jgi:prevent-host-death family protein